MMRRVREMREGGRRAGPGGGGEVRLQPTVALHTARAKNGRRQSEYFIKR